MKIAFAVFIFIALATPATFLFGIWSGDVRWYWTGMVGAVMTVISLGFIGVIGETRD